MSTCFFDFGYPRNVSEIELMLKKLKHGSRDEALKIYVKTGFFDVPALYNNLLKDALESGKAELGYLYLPPYLTDLKNCMRYVSLIPFISSSTQIYLKSLGINEVLELGKSETFIKTWSNKILKETYDNRISLIFHSAPINDTNYKSKIDDFIAKLEKYTNKELMPCYVSVRNSWMGPPLSECYKVEKTFALTGFLLENAETIYEMPDADIKVLKLNLNEIKLLLYNFI